MFAGNGSPRLDGDLDAPILRPDREQEPSHTALPGRLPTSQTDLPADADRADQAAAHSGARVLPTRLPRPLWEQAAESDRQPDRPRRQGQPALSAQRGGPRHGAWSRAWRSDVRSVARLRQVQHHRRPDPEGAGGVPPGRAPLPELHWHA